MSAFPRGKYKAKIVCAFVALILGHIVGGQSLSVFIFSVFALSIMLQLVLPGKFHNYAPIFSMLINLAWIMFYLNYLLGQVWKHSLTSWMSVENVATKFHVIPMFAEKNYGISQIGALFVLVCPGAFSLIYLVWARRLRPRQVTHDNGNYSKSDLLYFSSIGPLAVIAVLKVNNLWQTLSLVMSGDGRNHFLWIEEIRNTSRIAIGITKITSPVLSHGICAVLSAGNGSVGVLQSEDIAAMLSMYLISMILIFMTIAGFVLCARKQSSKNSKNLSNYLIATSLGLVAFSSTILMVCLQDGFMSLYFGVSVLGCTFFIYLLASNSVSYFWVITLGLANWVLIGAYSFLLLPGLCLTAIVFLRTVISEKSRIHLLGLLIVSILVFYTILQIVDTSLVERIKYVGALPGAVAKTDLRLIFLVIFCSACVALWEKTYEKWFAFGISLGAITTAISVFLIESFPGNEGPGFSYYSSKIIWGCSGAFIILLTFWVGKILEHSFREGQFESNRKRVGCTAFSILLVFTFLLLTESTSNLQNPIVAVKRGWISPDGDSVKGVVDRWGEGPTLYFRYVDLGARRSFPDAGQDRIANFWSPAFWGSEGPWGDEYNWTYNDFISSEVGVICPRLKTRNFTVVTRENNLESDVRFFCPGTNTKFVVLPRLQS